MKSKILGAVSAVILSVNTSFAQSNVYSVNIVGYVKKFYPAGTLMCVGNPLTDGTNTLNSVLGSLPAKSTAQFWTGSGFTTSSKGSTWTPNYAIPPGLGFFVNSKSDFTNTFVGAVDCLVGGLTTNVVPPGPQFVASKIPYAACLNDTNLNLGTVSSKSTVQRWTGTGYATSTKGVSWSPEFCFDIGEGFVINSKSAYNWLQHLPAQ